MQSFNFSRVAIFTGAEPFFTAISEIIRKELSMVGVVVTDLVTLPGFSSGDRSSSLADLAVIRQRCRGRNSNIHRSVTCVFAATVKTVDCILYH